MRAGLHYVELVSILYDGEPPRVAPHDDRDDALRLGENLGLLLNDCFMR